MAVSRNAPTIYPNDKAQLTYLIGRFWSRTIGSIPIYLYIYTPYRIFLYINAFLLGGQLLLLYCPIGHVFFCRMRFSLAIYWAVSWWADESDSVVNMEMTVIFSLSYRPSRFTTGTSDLIDGRSSTSGTLFPGRSFFLSSVLLLVLSLGFILFGIAICKVAILRDIVWWH